MITLLARASESFSNHRDKAMWMAKVKWKDGLGVTFEVLGEYDEYSRIE